MRITERYRRRDVGHLDVEITFDDPVVYTQAVHDQGDAPAAGRHRHPRILLQRERKGSGSPDQREIGVHMRSTLAVAAACAALLVGSLGARVSGSTGPIPLDCNRACLEGLIDQYLKAVVAHDPSKRAALEGRDVHREQPGDRGRRRVLEDGAGPGQLPSRLRGSRVRPGRDDGDDDGGGDADPHEPPPARRARPHHRDRVDLLQAGRRRSQQHRRDGQDGQGRGPVVPDHPAGAAAARGSR